VSEEVPKDTPQQELYLKSLLDKNLNTLTARLWKLFSLIFSIQLYFEATGWKF